MTTNSPERQVWLSRLQVINWGVFDGYHDLRLSRAGTLITGASGSGKSSLLDAVSLAFLSAIATQLQRLQRQHRRRIQPRQAHRRQVHSRAVG